MIIREFKETDKKIVKEIFALHFTDPEFIDELLNELETYIQKGSKKDFGFFIIEKNNKILGIAGFRCLINYLRPFAETNNPIELYIIAVKYQRKGIGKKLALNIIEKLRDFGFSEILLYSPNSHNESWDFYERIGFNKVKEITPPDDEIGQVWRKAL
ncbi:MAG: hypothetical protein COV57_01715 [Candidatus Liptonbacteria bacterium CG11_big_fil_rev_8_21_14_0_20_35_14]|uniref:N-acetyltransferase domain-containing protein n=1 Tax=Candidatus Liptonbacteria bacterium CG11_big_fil_rev_8_21_14_0_20_35_14 TaxID=1974634 RepID=A0A2H0N9X4_9BACT|nr:MAG: hypothetical protein COV57_01715 [Candidatus Liptonbacteria bacterium CG11_big_fil_rev_8_21_14_0_20_35_14]